ncbi:MAG TPA: amidohydrolase [Blastocatellia bacterium]|nr:amidohydrolase [Blastocatellia bacterium]HMY76765.1 amidohydrolase [Blastocatellia bacterium]HMZ16798.1 amidohydrolase [Blastocatellia bacterium]HNG30426.1 amidohydrolase [Blastocatellia bacterium]
MKKLLSILVLFSVVVAASAQQRPASTANAIDLLITGGAVVTMDGERRVIDDGFVAVRGERIVEVGDAAQLKAKNYRAKQTIDARGKVVLPGLINTHTHIPMVMFRGIADDLNLQDWLTKYIFPAEAKNVTREFVVAGTRLGLAEMIRGGTTTYADMYYFEDAIAEETKKAGVRGVLGETVIDFPVPDNKTWAEAMSYSEKFLQRWKGDSLITAAIAPHAPYTVNTAHLNEVRALAEKLDAPIIIHLAEAPTETEFMAKTYNSRPATYLEKINFLSPRVLAAHVVHVNDEEIAVLKRREVGVGHCPQSNMKLASGTAPVPAMLKAGVRLGLGTDGAASNHDLSMWEEMDSAAKLHKLIANDPTVVPALQALEMATIGGARAIHQEKEIGSLEAGKRADVIVVDFNAPHLTPMYTFYSHLVYAAKASDVTDTIVNGRVLMRNRRLLTLNEEAVKAAAREYQKRVSQSLKQ